MVESSDPTLGVDARRPCRTVFQGADQRRVLLDAEMRPIIVVVGQVLAEQAPKMPVVEHDGVVEQFAPYRSHESLGHSVLPWALVACPRGLERHRGDRGDPCWLHPRIGQAAALAQELCGCVMRYVTGCNSRAFSRSRRSAHFQAPNRVMDASKP